MITVQTSEAPQMVAVVDRFMQGLTLTYGLSVVRRCG